MRRPSDISSHAICARSALLAGPDGRWGRRFAVPILLSASLIVSGCQAYLHNEGRASVTADVKAKTDKLSAPTYFEAQEKNLADLAAQEDAALADLMTASRDYRLLNIIRPSTAVSERIGREERLARLIASDLNTTYGQAYLSADTVQRVTTSPFVRATALHNIDFQKRRAATTAVQYKSAGGTLPTDCAKVLANPGAAHAEANLARRYQKLVQACSSVRSNQDIQSNCAMGASAGDLFTACAETLSLDDDPVVKAKRTELAAAEKALREAMKAAKPSDEARALADAQDFIDKLDGLPSDEAVEKILGKVEGLFGAQLRDSLRDLQEGATATATSVSTPLAIALDALGAATAYRDAVRVKPSETASAMLIGIAKIRHELNILDVAIGARRLDREIIFQQAEALRNQLSYLAQAQKSLCGARRRCGSASPLAFSEALAFYARSQNVGRGPYEILSFRRLQLERATALKEAKATEADYRSLIQPAIDQLTAYGAGGIKAETIAHFLSSLPPAGAILVE